MVHLIMTTGIALKRKNFHGFLVQIIPGIIKLIFPVIREFL